MCGIVGMIGRTPVADRLLDSLRRLEYRGYDSAGIATLEDGKLARLRAEGKLKNLQERLARQALNGMIGIGHTRWATHGRPTEANAHPHATDAVAVVHNGIIENFRALRQELNDDGVTFKSDTDTEVVVHLITRELNAGQSPIDAVFSVLPRLQGSFALVFLFRNELDMLIGARKGSPLAVGHGDGEIYVASDAIALAPLTRTISYLEDGDLAVLRRDGIEVRDSDRRVTIRPVLESSVSTTPAAKGNYRHFMIKEIYEQPEVVGQTLEHYIDASVERIDLAARLPFDFAALSKLSILACGTAYYAAFIAKYWFEIYARLSVEVDLASEYRYRATSLSPGDVSMFVSQSGETADTLACLGYASQRGGHTLSVVNVPTSSLARKSDVVMPTLAGPEIGVASTKAFTCQLAVLACLAIAAGRARGVISPLQEQMLVRSLRDVPRLMHRALEFERDIETLARQLAESRDMLFLGRGTSYPLALEGALKVKELSYIHAEGYAAGELKHGPIALIDETVPVVVIAPYDNVFGKTVSNMQEVTARGGNVILITDRQGQTAVPIRPYRNILLPNMPAFITPLVYAIPLQLMAYHIALRRRTDVDQPRNLAKSVTVE